MKSNYNFLGEQDCVEDERRCANATAKIACIAARILLVFFCDWDCVCSLHMLDNMFDRARKKKNNVCPESKINSDNALNHATAWCETKRKIRQVHGH